MDLINEIDLAAKRKIALRRQQFTKDEQARAKDIEATIYVTDRTFRKLREDSLREPRANELTRELHKCITTSTPTRLGGHKLYVVYAHQEHPDYVINIAN